MIPQSCIKLHWYAWKTDRKGWVKFQEEEAATKAKEMLSQHKLDDKKIHVIQ